MQRTAGGAASLIPAGLPPRRTRPGTGVPHAPRLTASPRPRNAARCGRAPPRSPLAGRGPDHPGSPQDDRLAGAILQWIGTPPSNMVRRCSGSNPSRVWVGTPGTPKRQGDERARAQAQTRQKAQHAGEQPAREAGVNTSACTAFSASNAAALPRTSSTTVRLSSADWSKATLMLASRRRSARRRRGSVPPPLTCPRRSGPPVKLRRLKGHAARAVRGLECGSDPLRRQLPHPAGRRSGADLIETAWMILNRAETRAGLPAQSVAATLSTAPKPSQ